MTPTNPRRRRRAVAAVAALGLVVAACGSDDDDSDTGASTDPPAADTGSPGTAAPGGDGDDNDDGEQVTLRVSYVNDPIGADTIAAFESAYPNIDIEATLVPFSDYVNTITLNMASDSAPDIAQYNAGAMRTLIPAGELLNLNDYEASLGWADAFPKSSLDVLRTDETAKRFGTDDLYAVPGGLSVTGIYYNKQIAADLGIELPAASLGDLEAAFQTALDAGVTPVYVGGLDYNSIHWWAALVNAMGSNAQYQAWAYGDPAATIVNDPARQATELFADWSAKGYIPSSAAGTSAADAAAEFTAGNSLLHLDGNWQASAFNEAMGDNVGFFLVPMADGSPATVASGASVAWSVSARTDHPDEAVAFLDFMASAEGAAAQVGSGFMAVNAAAAPEVAGVVGEINTAFAVVAENDGIMPFPDFPAPALLELLTAGLQSVLAGQMDADTYLQSLQDAWAAYVTN
ncbi:MAG TPA: extracellular solute-binding protein [Ilumatobacter sp.]|nr:extracellular solute-binding protein [Ilumatobacter sp.]